MRFTKNFRRQILLNYTDLYDCSISYAIDAILRAEKSKNVKKPANFGIFVLFVATIALFVSTSQQQSKAFAKVFKTALDSHKKTQK
jgi:hypothetical protein